jgi:hypothetical protein
VRHQIDDVALSKPVVIPKVIEGIDFEGRSFVTLAQGTGIPQFTSTHASTGWFALLSVEVSVNRDGSCLVSSHENEDRRYTHILPKKRRSPNFGRPFF